MTTIELRGSMSNTTAAAVTWASPADGLWVGSLGYEYAGMVETDALGFRATDAEGRECGSFAMRSEAFAAAERGVAAYVDTTSTWRGTAVIAVVAGIASVIATMLIAVGR